MDSVDIRWLEVFSEIYKTRSVSRAAENLAISQPAVSIALSHLRQHFNDQLFVRTSKGMEPTIVSKELLIPVTEALNALSRAMGMRSSFNPLESNRLFSICMSDMTQIMLLPKLWAYLRTHAPMVRVDIHSLSDDVARVLESGKADLALGYTLHLETGFHEQALLRQSYVCAASVNHPRVRERLTLADFEGEDHAEVTRSGTGHLIVERELIDQGINRNVVLRVPNFLSVGPLMENTSLLVLIPEYLGQMLAGQGKTRAFPLPFELQGYAVKLYWHERNHRDAGIVWLRKTIRDLLAAAPSRH